MHPHKRTRDAAHHRTQRPLRWTLRVIFVALLCLGGVPIACKKKRPIYRPRLPNGLDGLYLHLRNPGPTGHRDLTWPAACGKRKGPFYNRATDDFLHSPFGGGDGHRFGVTAPRLQFCLCNAGPKTVMVPKPWQSYGLSFSLIIGDGEGFGRHLLFGLGKSIHFKMMPFPPGARICRWVSPLYDSKSDVYLKPGPYSIRVCVSPPQLVAYRSSFASRFHGMCSAPVSTHVTPYTPKPSPRRP